MVGRDLAVATRAEQVQRTRDLIMTTAERLFAERGVASVSARQIGEAAGQGNTAAVGYHFGTKAGLIEAMIRRHTGEIERLRARMTARAASSDDLREWVGCLVRPSVLHLAELGAPTWFARFAVQILADPELRHLLLDETFATPAISEALAGMDRCLSGLPPAVRAERDDMAYTLIIHVLARHERLLAKRDSGPRGRGAREAADSWYDAATGLIDALVGLYQAPVTPAAAPAAVPSRSRD